VAKPGSDFSAFAELSIKQGKKKRAAPGGDEFAQAFSLSIDELSDEYVNGWNAACTRLSACKSDADAIEGISSYLLSLRTPSDFVLFIGEEKLLTMLTYMALMEGSEKSLGNLVSNTSSYISLRAISAFTAVHEKNILEYKEFLADCLCDLLLKAPAGWPYTALKLTEVLGKTGISGCEGKLLGIFDMVFPLSNSHGSTIGEFFSSARKINEKDSFQRLSISLSMSCDEQIWRDFRYEFSELLANSGSVKAKEKFHEISLNTADFESFCNAASMLSREPMVLAGKEKNGAFKADFYSMLCDSSRNRPLFDYSWFYITNKFSGISADIGKISAESLDWKRLAVLVDVHGGCEFDAVFDRTIAALLYKQIDMFHVMAIRQFLPALYNNGACETKKALKGILARQDIDKELNCNEKARVRLAISKIDARIKERGLRVAEVVALLAKHTAKREARGQVLETKTPKKQ